MAELPLRRNLPLTERQQKALEWYDAGRTKKAIAEEFGKYTLDFAFDKAGRAWDLPPMLRERAR